jgi:hypothetical protein
MKVVASRRAAATLIASALTIRSPPVGRAAVERSEQQSIERALYSAPPPDIQSNTKQLSDAIPLKTMRGVWRLREYGQGNQLTAEGLLTFRGADSSPDRGTVTYDGDAGAGRGPWLLKADGFGRSQTGKGGIIVQKALWKLRRRGIGTFTYAGRASIPSYTGDLPDAIIGGPIIELVNGGKPKGGSEKEVGRFEASLLRCLTDAEEVGGWHAADESGLARL